MMDKHDEQLESFLREFQPRPPRALGAIGIVAPTRWRRLAAAAALAVAIGSSLWFVSRSPAPRRVGTIAPQAASRQTLGSAARPLALLPLTRLALTEPDRLDAALTEASRTVLPDLRHSDSTLRVLAKE
jgi:hypothetical protein